ncbi:metal ABC transporter permease, partial [Salmonella enterica subsp. enterica serovar Montevideo]|nr:metal ABC transporter permease [Salmonella enterica subsp. enterica serovar Montevideo]
FIAGLFCAIATGYLDDNSRIKRDTVMGIVFSGMFGAGLVLYVLFTLSGSVLSSSLQDQLAAVAQAEQQGKNEENRQRDALQAK